MCKFFCFGSGAQNRFELVCSDQNLKSDWFCLANFVLIKVHQGHFNLKCLDFNILILFKMRRFRVNQLFE